VLSTAGEEYLEGRQKKWKKRDSFSLPFLLFVPSGYNYVVVRFETR